MTPRALGLGIVLGLLLAAAPAGAATPPVITEAPAIAGVAQEGATLTAKAAWTGDPAPTAAWSWSRCDPLGTPCTVIAGAAAPTYVVAHADVGRVLVVQLTVASDGTTDTRQSAPTAGVRPAPPPPPPPPPVITDPPVIHGSPVQGATLTAKAAWTGDPATTVTWTWRRCYPGGSPCKAIAGATTPTYVLAGEDVGLVLRVRLTVQSNGKSDTSQSAPTAVVTAPSPPPPDPQPGPTPPP